MEKTPLSIVDFFTYEKSVPALMEVLGADQILADQKKVVIKPNLVNTSPPPITTPVQLVAAIVDYVKAVSNAEIFIAEGCGAPLYNTHRPFHKLGYTDLAKSNGAVLVDLNHAETTGNYGTHRSPMPGFSEVHDAPAGDGIVFDIGSGSKKTFPCKSYPHHEEHARVCTYGSLRRICVEKIEIPQEIAPFHFRNEPIPRT